MVGPYGPQITIQYGACALACRITMATDTHSEYVTLTAFPQHQRLREYASVFRCAYTARLVTFLE
jgi:hypothetical protein